jgi:hypothetical protein
MPGPDPTTGGYPSYFADPRTIGLLVAMLAALAVMYWLMR